MSVAALKAATTGTEVAPMKPKDKIAQLLHSRRGEIAKMLPKHLNADRLLKVAQIAATTTPALAECDIPSLIGAIGQCAQMGLEPNTVLGHAYLVPFNTKRKDTQGRERWVKSVQVVIGYKGLIDLARRSGQIVSIAAHEVCENDHFELVYGLDEKLNHTPAMGERGEIVGFYAVAKLVGGGHAFEFMSQHQVRQIMAATQSKGNHGPWKDHFTEMGRKTVIRRLAKYLPLSVEFQTAVALDNMAEGGRDQHMDSIDGEFTVLPDDAPAALEHEPSQSLHDMGGNPLDEQQPAEVEESRRAEPKRPERKQSAAPAVTFARVADQLNKATTPDELDIAADLIGEVSDEQQRAELSQVYSNLRAKLVE